MPRPLAVFDVDGTLVDSRWQIQEAMSRSFKTAGLTPPDYEATRQIVGLSLEVAIDRLAPRDITSEQLKALTEGYKTAFVKMRAAGEEREPLYDGAADLITRLKSDGWKLGIATGKSRRGLDVVMKREGWFDLFDCAYCADDGPGKPHPHMVELNAIQTGTLPSHSVMIGDTSHDMIAGKSANMLAIGVDWGFHTQSEILQSGADMIVSSMNELSTALAKFKTRVDTL